jgi:hypothetical protein
VDYKLVSIKNGGIRAEQRCKRPDCIFPNPIIHFDFDEGRIVAAWGWVGVQTARLPNGGLRVNIRPTLLFVRIGCN